MRDVAWVVVSSLSALAGVLLIVRLLWLAFIGEPIAGIGD